MRMKPSWAGVTEESKVAEYTTGPKNKADQEASNADHWRKKN